MGDLISQFAADLKRLRGLLGSKSKETVGFILDMEVAGLSVSPASSTRDV